MQQNVRVAADSANFTLETLEQQIDSLDTLINQLNDFNPNDWLNLLSGDFPDLYQIEAILVDAFGSLFTDRYFYTPTGTVYRFCVEGQYVGPPDQAHFYSQANVSQPGWFGQDVCTAVDWVTITP